MKSAPSPASCALAFEASADALNDGNRVSRPIAVLVAIYVLLAYVAVCGLGCQAKEIKTARPGIDQATGTAQSLQGQLDTIEYHARELRKGVK